MAKIIRMDGSVSDDIEPLSFGNEYIDKTKALKNELSYPRLLDRASAIELIRILDNLKCCQRLVKEEIKRRI